MTTASQKELSDRLNEFIAQAKQNRREVHKITIDTVYLAKKLADWEYENQPPLNHLSYIEHEWLVDARLIANTYKISKFENKDQLTK